MKPSRSRPRKEPSAPRLSDEVAALAAVMLDCDLQEIEIERPGEKLRLRRGASAAATSPAGAPPAPSVAPPAALHAPPPPAAATPLPPPPAAPAEIAAPGHPAVYITSPFVGTFYRSPGPDAPPFVDVGSRIRKGQVLCIIEAMKLMNEIEAEVDGTIVGCLAENGQPVEYGEPLFQIRP